MKPIKVLFAHGGTLDKAGTEAYMMSVFDNVNPEEVHIDFLVFGCKPGFYDDWVLSKGSKIFRVPVTPKDFIMGNTMKPKIMKELKNERYDIVHSHMNAMSPHIFRNAKKLEIPIMIAHSHGSRHFVEQSFLIKYSDREMKKIPLYTQELIACSKEAGDFLYQNHPYTVINNGIDLDAYRYQEEKRQRIREVHNLDRQFVIGHVGRFNFQKNHKFLIDIFAEVKKLEPSSILALVGEGELEPEVRKQVKMYGLQDSVRFLGLRDDVPDLLQVMDVFVMPSLFEGLPFVLVEAQAAGVPCVASDTIDQDSKLIESFEFLPLDNPKKWAEVVINMKHQQRYDTRKQLIERGFDVKTNVDKLVSIYREAVNRIK